MIVEEADFNFSFSGLKTAVLYAVKKLKDQLPAADYQLLIPQLCHEFQQAAVEVLVKKTIKAAQKYEVKTIMLAGGVSAADGASAAERLRPEAGAASRRSGSR